MPNKIKGSSHEKSKRKQENAACVNKRNMLKNVCIVTATAFPGNCASLTLLFREKLFGVFPVQLQLDNTFNIHSNMEK